MDRLVVVFNDFLLSMYQKNEKILFVSKSTVMYIYRNTFVIHKKVE